MNWMKNRFTGFAIALITILFLNSCTYQDPEVASFEGIEVISIEDKLAEIDINFSMSNPNKHQIKLKDAEFDVRVNNTYLGKAVLMEPITLPKDGIYPVKMHMQMQMDKSITEVAVSLGIAVLMNNVNMKVKGEAKGSMGWLSKTIEIEHQEHIDWNDLQEFAQ